MEFGEENRTGDYINLTIFQNALSAIDSIASGGWPEFFEIPQGTAKSAFPIPSPRGPTRKNERAGGFRLLAYMVVNLHGKFTEGKA